MLHITWSGNTDTQSTHAAMLQEQSKTAEEDHTRASVLHSSGNS